MALYRYVKAPPQIITPHPPSQAISLSLPKISLSHFAPYLLMLGGFAIITTIVSPILYHELIVFPSLQKATIISPLTTTFSQAQQLTQVSGVSTSANQESLEESSTQKQTPDLTQANNWFPTAPISQVKPSRITHYTIDIPSLDIKNAVVEIGGNDLSSHLIQYAETSNPGEFGSPVIFGHSILRQFYNPSESNPRRYISIFSTIMTLEEGDEIFINFDGIKYSYKVNDKYEVKPEQVEVLQQRYDRRGLKLITCTPEGTYLRRGVIEAQLVQAS